MTTYQDVFLGLTLLFIIGATLLAAELSKNVNVTVCVFLVSIPVGCYLAAGTSRK